MTQKERKCLACGRPLTGRKRKWCGHPDCGGMLAVHPGLTFRNPANLSTSEIDELLVDYIRRDKAEVYIIECKKLGPRVKRETETKTVTINGEPISFDDEIIWVYMGHYNPNYCETCKAATDHDQHGYCLACRKKNPTALSVCYCDNCSDYTLNDALGICLKCDKRNPRYILGDSAPREIINKRTA